MQKEIIISIIVAIGLIGGAYLVKQVDILPRLNNEGEGNRPINNVTIVDGKQIVEIRAKGGYKPRVSIAKSGVPTVLRFNTQGTFDCSSSVRIPSLDISKILPQSGVTDIDIGIHSDTILEGSCGMGMYPFEIEFQKE